MPCPHCASSTTTRQPKTTALAYQCVVALSSRAATPRPV